MKTDKTKVFFRYEKEEIEVNGEKKLVTKLGGKIEAVAISLEDKTEIARREVKLRHGDQPDKILGRKYAFKKLMDFTLDAKLLPGKEVENLWKGFSTMCTQPYERLAY